MKIDETGRIKAREMARALLEIRYKETASYTINMVADHIVEAYEAAKSKAGEGDALIAGLDKLASHIESMDSASGDAVIIRQAIEALTPHEAGWLPIESAPRNMDILVAYQSEVRGWQVVEAWWTSPHEGAPADRCSWRMHGTKTLLDKSIHGIGASHWMPLPKPPASLRTEEVQEVGE